MLMGCFARCGSEASKHKKRRWRKGRGDRGGVVVPDGGKQEDASRDRKRGEGRELTLAGEGLRGDCSMVCFLQGVPSTPPFCLLASMVVDCCCPDVW